MSYTHLGDTKPKARKTHQCRVCGDLIERGEVYIARRGIGYDGPETVRFHTECEAYSAKHWDDCDWEILGPGEVTREEVLNQMNEEAHEHA